MIPSPSRDVSSLKRAGEGWIPGEMDVVRIVKNTDVFIALLRSCGVSGLCRWDRQERRDYGGDDK